MKKAILAVIVIILIGAVVYYFWNKYEKPRSNKVFVSGTIETTDVDVGFQIGGKIVVNRFQEGDRVKKGELMMVLDDKDLKQKIKQAEATKKTVLSQMPQLETKILTNRIQEKRQLEQAQATIEMKKNQYISTKLGTRDEQIKQAKNVVAQARHTVELNKIELVRAQNLYKDGAMPAQQRDQAETAYLTSRDQLRQAIWNYRYLVNGPREQDIEAARDNMRTAEANYRYVKTQALVTKQLIEQRDILKAQLNEAEQTIKQAKIQEGYTRVYSPIDGIILVREKEPGEVVAAGTPVVTMANIERVYLKAYVGETDMARVKLGQKVTITNDTYKNKTYFGDIYFISSEAEFTPKNLTTKDDREKLVYRIKIGIDNKTLELHPGMIADGLIDVGGN